MAPLRVAVAGVGSFTQRVLIPGLIATPDADLVAVFGPTAEKTQKLAAEKGIPQAFSDYERMLDEVRPEAVVVATPNDVHAPMSLAAIRRGMHVFCEKPLGLTVAEAEEMADAARKAGVRTAVNFTYRSTNPMRHVRHLMDQGRLGTPYHFSITFWQNLRTDPAVPIGYRMLRERGGGALLDIGVHMMDLIRWFFGGIEAVAGITYTGVSERPAADGGRAAVTADDVTSFLVRIPGGATGTVQVSQIASGRQNYRRVELSGSNGAIMAEEDRTLSPIVRVAPMGGAGFEVDPIPDDVNVSFDDFPGFHLGRIVRHLKGDTSDPWPTFEDGLIAQRAVAAVEESQNTGRWISLT